MSTLHANDAYILDSRFPKFIGHNLGIGECYEGCALWNIGHCPMMPCGTTLMDIPKAETFPNIILDWMG